MNQETSNVPSGAAVVCSEWLGRWINVKDKMPEYNQRVIAWLGMGTGYGSFVIAWRKKSKASNQGWVVNSNGLLQRHGDTATGNQGITWWMPLPFPPNR